VVLLGRVIFGHVSATVVDPARRAQPGRGRHAHDGHTENFAHQWSAPHDHGHSGHGASHGGHGGGYGDMGGGHGGFDAGGHHGGH
jgi:hypothetical protein